MPHAAHFDIQLNMSSEKPKPRDVPNTIFDKKTSRTFLKGKFLGKV